MCLLLLCSSMIVITVSSSLFALAPCCYVVCAKTGAEMFRLWTDCGVRVTPDVSSAHWLRLLVKERSHPESVSAGRLLSSPSCWTSHVSSLHVCIWSDTEHVDGDKLMKKEWICFGCIWMSAHLSSTQTVTWRGSSLSAY